MKTGARCNGIDPSWCARRWQKRDVVSFTPTSWASRRRYGQLAAFAGLVACQVDDGGFGIADPVRASSWASDAGPPGPRPSTLPPQNSGTPDASAGEPM